MVTLLLPAAVSASFLSLCCGCVGARYTHIDCHGTAQFRTDDHSWRRGYSPLLSVIAIGVIWIVAVSPVDMVWSVAGMRESADLIGSGTSVQRSLGYTYGHDALVPRGVAVWLAVIISAVAVMSVWIAISILGHRRRLAPPRPSVKTNRYSCSLTVLSLRCMSTYFLIFIHSLLYLQG